MTTDKNKRLFQVTAEDFKKIPGSPIAYWNQSLIKAFEQARSIEQNAIARSGLSTGDNDKYMFMWYELPHEHIAFNLKNNDEFLSAQKNYVPCKKGGSFRRWYGDCEYVVNWKRSNEFHRPRTTYMDLYYKPGISWSAITSGKFHCRYYGNGFLFDHAAASLFPNNRNEIFYYLAFMETSVFRMFLETINPTINTGADVIVKIPLYQIIGQNIVEKNAECCVSISQTNWDSYETSWDFLKNPLIEANQRSQTPGTISGAYLQLRAGWQAQCEEMRRLEVENNRIFIEAYGLQEELTPDVPWNEITLTCNPWYRYGKTPKAVDRAADAAVDSGQWVVDSEECHVGAVWRVGHQGTVHVSSTDTRIPACKMPFNQELETRLLADTIKELLSYAVGCMFGRYSLDVEGLAYAGGDWDDSKYTTIPAAGKNIIPICDDDYFEDDLTNRFVKFIETVYGAETLEENLNFIAGALGGRGSAREVIRSYFRNDFFEDHCKVYQKRPIYWLFDSGKKGGFRALMYMHRYQPDTVATLRTDYVHEQQERYRTAIADLATRVDNATGSEKVKLSKQLALLRDQAEETRIYEEKVHHLADQMISIDLDDGVKHNYAIFQDILAKIK